jgi:hypothetical protein
VDQLARYLLENSHLPGARANLALADEFARTASPHEITEFANRPEEYLRFCGTQGLGRLLAEDPTNEGVAALLRERASDPLWRVRESVARALQIVGDRNREHLRARVVEWISDPDPYVQRACLAAVCEPRLLSDDLTRATARHACERATAWIHTVPRSDRRRPDVRTLRQALGYCWSVAIAADPAAGFPAFDALRDVDVDDPDLRWIVASTLAKARVRKLLDAM